jgi:hypothetical protein
MKILFLVLAFTAGMVVFDGRSNETLAGPCNPNVQTC